MDRKVQFVSRAFCICCGNGDGNSNGNSNHIICIIQITKDGILREVQKNLAKIVVNICLIQKGIKWPLKNAAPPSLKTTVLGLWIK